MNQLQNQVEGVGGVNVSTAVLCELLKKGLNIRISYFLKK